MNRDEVREHLTGPITSIATPFKRDGSVDYESLRRQLDLYIDAGSKTMLLTVGDSQYICLSDDEIAEITRVTIEHTARRAMVVAADRYLDTRRSVAFAEFAKGLKADVLMVLPPNWAVSCTPESAAVHYATVAEVMPVMIVTGLFTPHGAAFALEAIERSLDASPNIVAIKDDMCGDFARRLGLLAHERVAVFSGGQKVNHINMWPYGCDGYMSTLIMFRPEIPQRYWQAVEAHDLATVRQIIRDYDMPLFDHMATYTGGWNAALHGALEIFGVAERWRRPPYYSLDDEEMERLRSFFDGKHLLPGQTIEGLPQ